ncbi:MAG: HEAT repeat domain-containing protein, partial [Planctomycetaceae bacterium]
MSSWRSTGFALWAIAAIAVTGCSSTSIPSRALRLATGQAGPGSSVPFDRLVMIGETFEAQGNYAKAQRMFNIVLSKNPNNTQAAQAVRRIAARQQNNGKVFEGTGNSGSPTNLGMPETMMASAQAGYRAASPTPPPVRETVRKPIRTLVAASTIPTRSTQVGAPFKAPSRPVVEPVAKPAPEDWALPRIAPSPVFNNPETGRVTMVNHETPQPSAFEMPKLPAGAQPVVPAAINIEACLDNPAGHVPTLISSLTSADPDVRSLAAFLLGEAGVAGRDGLADLQTRLSAESADNIRITVAESVSKLDRTNLQARSVLISTLRSGSPALKSQAAFALRVFAGSGDQEVLETLSAALSETNTDVVSMAALSLSDFGPQANGALAALEAAKQGTNQQVREA